MDHLWTQWRFAYVPSAKTKLRPGVTAALDAWKGDKGCVFCNHIASIDDAISKGMSPEDAEAAGGLVPRDNHSFIWLFSTKRASCKE